MSAQVWARWDTEADWFKFFNLQPLENAFKRHVGGSKCACNCAFREGKAEETATPSKMFIKSKVDQLEEEISQKIHQKNSETRKSLLREYIQVLEATKTELLKTIAKKEREWELKQLEEAASRQRLSGGEEIHEIGSQSVESIIKYVKAAEILKGAKNPEHHGDKYSHTFENKMKTVAKSKESHMKSSIFNLDRNETECKCSEDNKDKGSDYTNMVMRTCSSCGRIFKSKY